MRLLSIFVPAVAVLLSNSCTKLKNRVLPVSYTCGQEAKDWSDRFVKVYDSQDQVSSGQNISADLNGTALQVSDKGCVKVPQDANQGRLTIRDNRPSKQEGKILPIDGMTYPASVRLDVLSALVPQITCGGETFATNSSKVDILISGPTLEQPERFKIIAGLKSGENTLPLSSTFKEKILHVDLGNTLLDGDYKVDVISVDELRKEQNQVKTCNIKLDRTAPGAGLEIPRKPVAADGIPRVKTDEKIKFSSDDSSSQILFSLVKREESAADCSLKEFFPVQIFETPKQGRWFLCYYARDPAGNFSKVESFGFEIDEEPRRVLIEKLIDNAKLNAEKFRYEAARESIERAYTEWKNLALVDDQKALLPELKSGFYEVLQRDRLQGKKAIETYASALPLGQDKAMIFREKDIAIVSIKKEETLSGQADLGMVEGYSLDSIKERFAVGDSNGRVRVVDSKLKTVLDYEDPDQSVFQKMSFSKNGAFFAAGTVFGTVLVWDLNTNKIKLQKDLGERIHGLAFDIKGNRILVAAGGDIKSITMDDASTEAVVATFDEGIENIASLDEKTLLVQSIERVSAIDLATGKAKDILSSKKLAIEETKVSSTGKVFSVKFENGTVRIFMRDKYTEIKSPEIIALKSTAVSLADSTAALVDIDGFVRVFSLPSLELVASFRLAEGEAIQNIWFEKDGSLFSNTSQSLAKWNLANPLLKSMPLPTNLKVDEISDISFSTEPKLELAFRDGTLVTSSENKVKQEKTVDGIGYGFTAFGHNTILRFGLETAIVFNKNNLSAPVRSFKIDDTANPESFLWNAMDESFYLGSEGFVKLYDLKGNVGLSLETIQPPYPVLKIAVAERSVPIISGGERRGVISIWAERNSANPPKEFDAHELKVSSLAFVDKENSFVSASEDGSIGLWKSDGTSMRKVSAHPGEVRQLVFHASDGDIFTIGEDKNLRVWRRDLKALTSIPLPATAKAIKLSSDNRKMSVVLENGQAFIFPSSVDELHNALNGIP